MKKNYVIGLIFISLLISQQLFPQKENTKNPSRGEQQIELIQGYSFVSSRIISENPDLVNILQDNLENIDFVRNTAGAMLRKIGPNWVNTIGDWVNSEGYVFKMNTTDELTVTGEAIDPQTPIDLHFGYQVIGYLPEGALNAEEVFEGLLENLEFVRNSEGMMLIKIGEEWVNNIGDMQPGQGYLVRMFAADVLIYPGSLFTCGDPFTDPRNEQTYETVQIGDQCWMAENLNIGEMINGTEEMTDNGVIEKYCYDNDPVNCETYGGLYQWDEMMEYTTTPVMQGICPSGWHVPTDDEWKILEGTVDSQYPVGDPIWNNTGSRGYDAGKNLKSTIGWNLNTGTDTFGFTALPAGYRKLEGSFNFLGDYCGFWSSSEHDTSNAWGRALYYIGDGVGRDNDSKSYGFSSRCVQD